MLAEVLPTVLRAHTLEQQTDQLVVLPSKGVADNLLEDRIGCVGIQIKNLKNIAKIKPTTMHMKKHRDDINNYGDGEVAPGFLILMHMSTEKKKTGKLPGCQECNETLVVRGLDDLIIKDDVKVAVEQLLLDTPDPLKVLELEVKDMSNSDAYLPLFTGKAIARDKKALKDILQSVRNDSADTSMPVPGADTSMPGEDTSVPSADTSMPGEDTSVPSADTSVPGADTSMPGEDTSVPSAKRRKL